MNRRDFLGKSLICSLALDRAFLRAAKARAQSLNAPAGPLFSIEKLGENVFAAIAKPVTLLNCNAAIFVNFNDILVVDSHSKPSAARALIDTDKDAESIVRRSLDIAADICVFTNRNVTIEMLQSG